MKRNGKSRQAETVSGMKKGVDDFAYLLIISVVVLVALFMLSPLLSNLAGTQKAEPKAIFTYSPGTIGYTGSLPARKSLIGDFDASLTQTTNLKQSPMLSVSRGISSGQPQELEVDVPDYYMDSMKGIIISFDVDDTNRYGNLQVSWDGRKELDENTGPKHISIVIPKERIGKANTLRIDATGPGLYFWASAVYSLKGFSVDLETIPGKVFAFPMSKNDIGSFVKGQIDFFGSGGGKLDIKLNGVPIYGSVSDGVTSVGFNFSTAPLMIGQNIISFSADSKAMVNGAKLSVYLLSGQQKSETVFNITQDQLTGIRKSSGSVDVDVNFVFRDGKLGVSLNGRSIGELSPAAGHNTFAFRGDDVVLGKNTIGLEGTGEFEINSVKISYLAG